MPDLLAVEIARGVAWVTIDHPPDQLVDADFVAALATTVPTLETDPAVRVAVFASADPDFFLMHGDGIARGGGAELLTALDYRVASTRMVLGQPEAPMGILPGAGGSSRLPRMLGRRVARGSRRGTHRRVGRVHHAHRRRHAPRAHDPVPRRRRADACRRARLHRPAARRYDGRRLIRPRRRP